MKPSALQLWYTQARAHNTQMKNVIFLVQKKYASNWVLSAEACESKTYWSGKRVREWEECNNKLKVECFLIFTLHWRVFLRGINNNGIFLLLIFRLFLSVKSDISLLGIMLQTKMKQKKATTNVHLPKCTLAIQCNLMMKNLFM